MLTILKNIRQLRAAARECTIEHLEDILTKFEQIMEERRSEEQERQQELLNKRSLIEKYQQLLLAEGITPEDLTLGVPKNRKIRTVRPAKYQYTNENGILKTWTGQGRMPSVIKQALESGKTLEHFAI